MPRSYLGLCDQLTFNFRVLYARDALRDMTSLCDKCYEHVLQPGPCAGFVLSGPVRPITFHSGVFLTHILLGTPHGHLICVCMCDDSLYSVICGYVML